MDIQAVVSGAQRYFDDNNYEEGHSFLSHVIETNKNPDCLSYAHYLLGRIYFYQGRYSEAKKAFVAALKYKKNNTFTQFFLARALQLLGDHDDALKMYILACIDTFCAPLIVDFISDIISLKDFKDNDLSELTPPSVKTEKPLVSIVVLCYNKMEYTLKCLESIFSNTGNPSYEIIVVDNASADNTPAILEMYSKKITYIHSETNLGFVKGNNLAAEHAKGDYMVFLNNDTEVQKNWLSSLHKCFELYPHAGAAGSMLIYPDSKLQEAGGIIFNDASGWNYGKGGSIHDPRFLFVREVDYCSGAALMVRRDLFVKLGGFDTRFSPAYYEDTDLCFSLRKLGYQVLYCPSSRVLHHEGATAGTDLSAGFKKYQIMNKPKFQEKWRRELALHYPQNPALIYQFSNRKKGKRILIIDDWPPLPDKAAGCLKMYHTLKQMVDLGYQVTYCHLIGSNLGENAPKYIEEFQMSGVEFIYFNYEAWWAIKDSPDAKKYCESLIDSLELQKRRFDFVYICFWHIADYFIDFIRKVDPTVPVLVDSVDVHYLREMRQAEVLNDKSLKEKALQTKVKELKVYSEADCVSTVTQSDMDFLRKDLPDTPIFLLPTVHDPYETLTTFDQRKDFLFIGNFNHPPNEDAVTYFVQAIFPLIKREIPDAKFFVVGNNPTPKIKALSSGDIVVTGWVPEVKPYYEQCRVCVIPLRFGAGMKGKVGEALSYGLPMVSTSIGVEGMNIVDDTHAFVADDPETFAACAVRLYRERETWEQFSRKGKELLSDLCTSEVMKKRIEYITSYKTRKSLTSYRAHTYPTPPRVSIIVIAAGDRDVTGKCLNSIRRNIAISHETFFISKAGDAYSAALQNDYPELRIMDGVAFGYPDSVNRALSNALGDYIVLVRDTIEFADDAVATMVSSAEQSQEIGLVTISGPNNFNCLLIKQEVVTKIGGIDERFAPGDLNEDVDFILRALCSGFKLQTIEGAIIFPPPKNVHALDETIFTNKWGFSPSAALQHNFAAMAEKRDLRFPIDIDTFIENYERALLHSRDDEHELALHYFQRAVDTFHRSERKGYVVEYPDVLFKAGQEALKGNKNEKALEYLKKAVELTPFNKDYVTFYESILLQEENHQPRHVARKFVKQLENDDDIKTVIKIPEMREELFPKHSFERMDEDDKTANLTSIIILAHNRWDQTERCLQSIERHTPEPHEIIIVDNNSSDETRTRLQRLIKKQGSRIQGFEDSRQQGSSGQGFKDSSATQQDSRFQGFKDSSEIRKATRSDPSILESLDPVSSPGPLESSNPTFKVILNNTNRGYAAGNNQGISIARGDYILLLNNDTVVTPGWLGNMISVMNRFPKTGLVGPMSNYVGQFQLIENADYDNPSGIDDFAVKWAEKHKGLSFTSVKASGFCLLIKKEVIHTIGGLDEQFGSGYFEDDDFCSRAFLTGIEIRIAQDVFIHHEGNQTFKGAGIDYNAKMEHNWELYKAKWDFPKDATMAGYWVPPRFPESVSHFFPLPDLSSDHAPDQEGRWWEDIRKKEEQGKGEMKAKKKEQVKGLTSILLVPQEREFRRKCVESIYGHTTEPYELLFIPPSAAYSPPKWLRKMLKEKKNYRLVIPPTPPLEKGGTDGGNNASSNRINKISPTLEKGGKGGFSDEKNLLTYAQTCNTGIAETKGEYIAILQDSVVVTEEWLTGMLEQLRSSDDTGLVGPMTVNVEGRQAIPLQESKLQRVKESGERQKEIPSAAGTPDPMDPVLLKSSNPETIDRFARSFHEKNRYRRVPVKNPGSFCLLFTHALTEKIGRFDERFETDEYTVNDYCTRIAAEDYRNLIAGDIFIYCDGSQPVSMLKDSIAFRKKWGNMDQSAPQSKKVYCSNALFLSDEFNQKGQMAKALDTLVDALKLYPDEQRLEYALAEALIENKKYKEAVDALERLPKGFKEDGRRLELLGTCKLYLGLAEEADRYADDILRLNNASPKAWNLKGTVAFEKKAYEDAERFFQKATESDRGFGEAYANIGALRWANGAREEALKLFERAFILSPASRDITTNYYTAVVTLSKLPEAETLLKEALALYPFNRRLKFILIDNLLQQEKFAAAMDEMENALAVFGVDDDTLAVALKLRERLQDSRGQGFKDSRKDLKTRSDPGSLESSNPVSSTGTLESSTPRTLSLCMIVKNEEANIVTALQSVKPIVDEMIVVDTGSADRTKKIASVFGAKVYDFPWNDSFADARNFALSKATGDWILVLDADEVISPADYEKLKELIKQDSKGIQQDSRIQGVKDSSEIRKAKRSNPVAYSFVTRNYVGPVCVNWVPNDGTYKEEVGSGWFPSEKVRLFPNDNRFRFENTVHELVEPSLAQYGVEIIRTDIPIHHYGKLDKDSIRTKGEAYYQLGKMKLAGPGEQDPSALSELAVQASELERYDEAIAFWEKALIINPHLAKAYYGLGACYYHLARYDEARTSYQKAMKLDPDAKDQIAMYTASELLDGKADTAVSLIENFLQKNPLYPLALMAATAAYFCAGKREKGLEYVKKVGQTQFSLAPYLAEISRLLISVRRFEYAARLLEAAVETGNTTAETRQLMEEIKQQDLKGEGSRIPGFKDSSEPLKKNSSPR